METLKVLSPAKVNLFLYVIGRLPGGYHELVTLFHRISLCDELSLRPSRGPFQLTVDAEELPTGSGNLITQAYWLLKETFPNLPSVCVHLKKRIPIQAGLGGGSSNAASFLIGMNRLFSLGLPKDRLAALGAKLGSDISFFTYGVNQALGTHRGEHISIRAARTKKWFVLIFSSRGLRTRSVYQGLKLERRALSLTKNDRIVRISCRLLDRNDTLGYSIALHNDLEAPAIQQNPSIREVLALVVQLGVPSVALSGSGPSVFAVLNRARDAHDLARQLKVYLPENRIEVCHTY